MADYYSEALKLGQKQFRINVAHGNYPYLPALDYMFPEQKDLIIEDIGLVDIPMEHVVGTKTESRALSFARNFMPLSPENSEFATKWKSLCESHLEEGIRDPIVAYEYLNRFYVLEGNKRISVLKFFKSPSIQAKIKRVVERDNNSPEYELYKEFLEFYNITNINFIEFSKKGSYRDFLRILGRENNDDWDEDTYKSVKAEYYLFRKAYDELGGDKLYIHTGDAMLQFILLYGASSLVGKSSMEIKDELTKIWPEVKLLQEDNPLEVHEAPEKDSANQGILNVFSQLKSVKCAFIYNDEPKESKWVLGHDEGRIKAEEQLEGRMLSTTYVCKQPELAYDCIKKAIEDGAKVVFAISSEMSDVCLKVATENPQVKILNCILNVPHKLVRSYFPRSYEAKFVMGAIAGAITNNDKVGYVIKYPIYGSIADVNSFSRGVAMTNPRAKVYLKWSGERKLEEIYNEFKSEGINILSVSASTGLGKKENISDNLIEYNDDNIKVLCTSIVKWKNYYRRIVKSILDGTYDKESAESSKSIAYFWGMDSDVVSVHISEDLPERLHYLGELLHSAIKMGVCRPFYSPEIDKDGNKNWKNIETSYSMEEIISMEYFEDNIVGKMPTYDEISDKAKDLVDILGVKAVKEDENSTNI